MPEPRRQFALLPLDERPVNTQLPSHVALVGGATLSLPPKEILPDLRVQGDCDALGEWLVHQASDPAVSHLIVSIDMLVYGGLIASRTSDDDIETCLRRLATLRRVKRENPSIEIFAVSLVMRATNSYSATEEPEYWSSYGKEIHEFGADAHRAFDSDHQGPVSTTVPTEFIGDHTARRLRNHIVNLATLDLLADDTLSFLAITADDTASESYGSIEQRWLEHWMRSVPGAERASLYPGADEVGAALVARALVTASGITPTIEVASADPEGWARVPKYENRPLSVSVSRQVAAAGASQVAEAADITLVIHAPDPRRHDMQTGTPADSSEAPAHATVALLHETLAGRSRVALADVRYPNGADEQLGARLIGEGIFKDLIAYGAWNTAGNTLGGVIATAVAAVVSGSQPNAENVELAKTVRLLDDYAYQSIVRDEARRLRGLRDSPSSIDEVRDIEAWVRSELEGALREANAQTEGWVITEIRLPWRRAFEVEVELAREVNS